MFLPARPASLHPTRWLLLAAVLAATPALAKKAPAALAPMQQAQQLVVVTTSGWDDTQGRLQTYVRQGKDWKPAGDAFAVAIGKSGSAWGEGLFPAQKAGPQKREGDGRSPAGIYGIGEAFGYAPSVSTKLKYQQMQASNWCIDVPNSPFYNQIVDEKDVGALGVEGVSEHMRLDLHNDGDVRYRQGFVIQHNASATPGRGSCIFAHLWRTPGEATAGCTAMAPANMEALQAWLDPKKQPLFVLLPKTEYIRLQHAWSLPLLTAGTLR
ncbi:L,D-peptidoglycan transpeptidase YkuD, ErfK/YbiS/YcfS/YnhG family [Pseudoxanthomonas sp. GM95]|uniref:L,D-transpeptidase family protein n=1 Tax=Pseudoxanthomonas sp. GM95 TaxID=1881043 RepID=UPI0008B6272E|nr:L,D-transpeptidase family protein [Pseudoxanthomonas sp. GM95]SEK39812.1 L,D-peptidoglycan transpeptidase YkuD, ErfK/YbiS/YcfS/YnhG family [Pseudoxanthomonas sp. GM95]